MPVTGKELMEAVGCDAKEIFRKHGVTMDKIAKELGKIISKRDLRSPGHKLTALDMALKVLGGYAATKQKIENEGGVVVEIVKYGETESKTAL